MRDWHRLFGLLLGQLFEGLRREGMAMSFTMEDFRRQYIRDHFRQLAAEEQRSALERLSPESRRALLQSLPAEAFREVLQSLPAEEHREVLQSLSAEERQEVLQLLPPEERMAGLSAEQIRQYLDRLTAGRPSRAASAATAQEVVRWGRTWIVPARAGRLLLVTSLPRFPPTRLAESRRDHPPPGRRRSRVSPHVRRRRRAQPARAGRAALGLPPGRRPAVPAVRDAAWVRTPIDAFILAQAGSKRA